ncbi:MAG: phytanoyl-CoA dioxygenase family protein [Acidobacteriota bacterium]
MNEGTYMSSDLWLDRPDGADLIRERLERDRLSSDEARRLRHFFEKGYLHLRLSEPAALFERLLADVDGFWKSRPSDIAYRFVGDPTSLADASERRERMAPCVLLNLHGHSEAARGLYLHPEIFSWVELIFDRKALAFESSFTEFGRSEAPYRDGVYIETSPASHLLTAWIALEDIEMEAGPLYVVSGSHRLPLFEFEPGRFRIRDGEDHLPARRFVAAGADRQGLPEEDLTLRRGEVVIWHPALVHGARRILKPWVTRRSFMVRFTTLGSMSSCKASFWKEVRGRHWKREKRLYWNETERLLEGNGCAGFDDPLRGLHPRGLTLWEKIRKNLRLGDLRD